MLGIARVNPENVLNWTGPKEVLGREYVTQFMRWMIIGKVTSDGKDDEKKVYFTFQCLKLFVADYVQDYLNSLPNQDNIVSMGPESIRQKPGRLFLPHAKTDVEPIGADKRHQVDALYGSSPHTEPVGRYGDPNGPIENRSNHQEQLLGDYGHTLSYYSGLAVGEIKPNTQRQKKKKALSQAFEYSRQIFANQPNRRFLWGDICRGNVVNMVHMGRDKALVSTDMDLTTPVGRLECIRYYFYWSFCGEARLGYDTSMRLAEDKNKDEGWNIKLFGDGEITAEEYKNAPEYRVTSTIKNATSLFGTASRCFIVKRLDKHGNVGNKEYILKDYWYDAGPLPR